MTQFALRTREGVLAVVFAVSPLWETQATVQALAGQRALPLRAPTASRRVGHPHRHVPWAAGRGSMRRQVARRFDAVFVVSNDIVRDSVPPGVRGAGRALVRRDLGLIGGRAPVKAPGAGPPGRQRPVPAGRRPPRYP